MEKGCFEGCEEFLIVGDRVDIVTRNYTHALATVNTRTLPAKSHDPHNDSPPNFSNSTGKPNRSNSLETPSYTMKFSLPPSSINHAPSKSPPSKPHKSAKMENEKGEIVDLSVPLISH